jgi:malonate-semialdehyde dehydrogenase (acetylating)/methylmalonate-semialdehyde dehydrogenase
MALLDEVKPHYGKLSPYIGGNWQPTARRGFFTDYNPAKDQPIAEVEISDAQDGQAAVEAAHNAFQSWKDVPFRDRADYLGRQILVQILSRRFFYVAARSQETLREA